MVIVVVDVAVVVVVVVMVVKGHRRHCRLESHLIAYKCAVEEKESKECYKYREWESHPEFQRGKTHTEK